MRSNCWTWTRGIPCSAPTASHSSGPEAALRKVFVTSCLAENFVGKYSLDSAHLTSFQVRNMPRAGRSMYATLPFAAGDVILLEDAVVVRRTPASSFFRPLSRISLPSPTKCLRFPPQNACDGRGSPSRLPLNLWHEKPSIYPSDVQSHARNAESPPHPHAPAPPRRLSSLVQVRWNGCLPMPGAMARPGR